MNRSKIAAALYELADAFLEEVEIVEEKLGKQTKGKAKAAVAEAAPVVSAPKAQDPADAARAPAEPPAPAAPTITKDQLNKLVLAVAAKDRNAAEAILVKFGHKNTVSLPPEQFQVVYDAFEEELARLDAAAVQVAQASLV